MSVAVAAKKVASAAEFPYITSVTADQMGLARQINGTINRVQQELASHADAINNLTPGQWNSGTNASATTFAAGDGTWKTALTSIPGTYVQGPGSSVVGDAVVWNNTAGSLVKDVTWTVITQGSLSLFSSTQQGVVPSSSGHSTSASYLGGDVAWHTLPSAPASGLTYLGTVSASSGTITDVPSGSNIIGANASSYRSILLIFKSIVPSTTGTTIQFQVDSGGSIQTSLYFFCTQRMSTSSSNAQTGTTTATVASISLTIADLTTNALGYNGEAIVSNLAGTSAPKGWFGRGSYLSNSNTDGYGNSTWAGAWNSNAAIDGFQLSMNSGSISSGSVDIYGIL